MERRNLLLIAALAPLAACTTTRGSARDPEARRREIDSGVDRAMQELTAQDPEAREMMSRARGVLVFPRVLNAGLGIGGSFGEGALREGRKTAGYYRIAGAQIGLLAGAQSRALFILFMTPDALSRFENSSGWTAGVDASVAFVRSGANAAVTTQTMQQPVIGYALTNAGLMYNLSIDGSKITRIDL